MRPIGFLTIHLRKIRRILTICELKCYAVRKVIAMNEDLKHVPVLLEEIISTLPTIKDAFFWDVTAGGAGHFLAIAQARPAWRGECWDRDPDAAVRVEQRLSEFRQENPSQQLNFQRRCFGDAPENGKLAHFILADIGVSSFQLDDPQRGMSLKSPLAPDFRMDPESGLPFRSWLKQTSEIELARIFSIYGEEPKARRVAHEMKSWRDDAFSSAAEFAERIKRTLGYKSPSRIHPATRVFQALRIAINDELGELERFLTWAPGHLAPGGRLAVISFHSLEDRIVKNRFRDLAATGDFVILTKKPQTAGEEEVISNPRARSAKLRVLERGPGEKTELETHN